MRFIEFDLDFTAIDVDARNLVGQQSGLNRFFTGFLPNF